MKGKRKDWNIFRRLKECAGLWLVNIAICMIAITQVEARRQPCDLMDSTCMTDFTEGRKVVDQMDTYDYCLSLSDNIQCLMELDCPRDDLFYQVNLGAVRHMWKRTNCRRYENETVPVEEARKRPPPPTTTEPYINLPSHTGCSEILPSEEVLYCAVFGDPHVITDKSHFQTCGIKGAYPMFENQYLTIQVKFDPVQRSSSPHTITAVSRVLVIVKPHKQCSPERKAYEATVGNMPAVFSDNTGDSETVQLIQRIPGRLHEIRITHLKAIIFIRNIGDYLSVAIRMHKPLMETDKYAMASYQLCSLGCPARDILSRHRILRELPLKPILQAEEWCTSHNLTGPFYEGCRFDAALTNDFNVVLVSKEAQQDWERLAPTMDGVRSAAWTSRYDMLPHAQSVRNSGVAQAVSVSWYYFFTFTFPAAYFLGTICILDWALFMLLD